MKIIDLLNMIAKGEEMPKRIKYNGEILEYNNATQDYEGISKTGTGDFFYYLFTNNFSTEDFINDEVEILEDTEEIDIQSIEKLPKIIHISVDDASVRTGFNNIIDNQNVILRAIKQLDNKLKEK